MKKRTVEFFKHNIDDEAIASLAKTAKNLFITTGPKTDEFEKMLAKYLGLGHAVGTMSCTHALHLAYRALGIGPGDEVIVPAFTFVATATAVLHAGAMPIFADVDPKTGILSPQTAEKALTKATKAIAPVHLYGVVAPMREFAEIAKAHNLKLVEDAAHCIEGRSVDFGPGQLSDAAAFSFYATKNITSGEGGALATNSKEVADEVKVLRNHGLSRSAMDRFDGGAPIYDVASVGFKSNMTDLQASLLIPQLKRIDKELEKRANIVARYNEGLKNISCIETPLVPHGQKSALHLYTIRIANHDKRDEMVVKLKEEGVNCSINYRPLSDLSFFRDSLGMKEEDFPNATAFGNSVVTLPLYPSLTDSEVTYVIEIVNKVAGKIL